MQETSDRPTPASFDDFPYPSQAYSATHPDHLATLATLSGLEPPPVERCRMLELGCASGGNLIPIAYSLPEGEFLGIDFSGKAIDAGQKTAAELGVQNVTLRHEDILALDDSIGQFDYIVAYGIFSWVPPEVQDKILEICYQRLAPNGTAYLSYNVYPGWRSVGTIRDLMLYHSRSVSDPRERIERGRALVRFMSEKIAAEGNYYVRFLRTMQELLLNAQDGYLRHDFLAEVNDPIYFYQFVERAEQHGLQYLANAELAVDTLPEEVLETVMGLADDMVEIEQYLDFMRNRTFRQTLFCRAEVEVDRMLDVSRVEGLRLASELRPAHEEPELQQTKGEDFVNSKGESLAVSHPLTKAALLYLASVWPRCERFDTVVREAQAILAGAGIDPGGTEREERQALALNVARAYAENLQLISLHSHLPGLVAEAGERPVASVTARHQASRNEPVTNLYHRRVTLSETARELLLRLDGTHERPALLELMVDLARKGTIEVERDGVAVEDADALKAVLVDVLDQQLDQLAKLALLVA